MCSWLSIACQTDIRTYRRTHTHTPFVFTCTYTRPCTYLRPGAYVHESCKRSPPLGFPFAKVGAQIVNSSEGISNILVMHMWTGQVVNIPNGALRILVVDMCAAKCQGFSMDPTRTRMPQNIKASICRMGGSMMLVLYMCAATCESFSMPHGIWMILVLHMYAAKCPGCTLNFEIATAQHEAARQPQKVRNPDCKQTKQPCNRTHGLVAQQEFRQIMVIEKLSSAMRDCNGITCRAFRGRTISAWTS